MHSKMTLKTRMRALSLSLSLPSHLDADRQTDTRTHSDTCARPRIVREGDTPEIQLRRAALQQLSSNVYAHLLAQGLVLHIGAYLSSTLCSLNLDVSGVALAAAWTVLLRAISSAKYAQVGHLCCGQSVAQSTLR